jgi:hypothetical protein
MMEYANTGRETGAEFQRHVRACARCNERWEDERFLTSQFRSIREAAASLRPSEGGRVEIMQEFARSHRRTFAPLFKWIMSAAAVLLLVIVLGSLWRTRSGAQRSGGAAEASTASTESPALLSVFGEDEFVAVPYAPPLAAGEFVTVVRMELRPTALARMGMDVDVTAANDIPADVVVGQDGSPRAVRVLDEGQFEERSTL